MEIIIVILLAMLLVLGALLVIPRSNNKGKANENSGSNGTTCRCYTKEEVSTHNTRNNCWIIIRDKAYDLTPYVEEHPGGDAILNNAGGDSTEGFFGRVFGIIEDFCIGKMKE